MVISAARTERLALLKHILASSCKARPISRILVRWFGDSEMGTLIPEEELDSICPAGKRVIVETMGEKNLTSRFKPSDGQ